MRQVRSKQQLSERRAGSSAATVRALESGTQLTIVTVEQLAAALGVSPVWLAFGTGPRELQRRGARLTVATINSAVGLAFVFFRLNGAHVLDAAEIEVAAPQTAPSDLAFSQGADFLGERWHLLVPFSLGDVHREAVAEIAKSLNGRLGFRIVWTILPLSYRYLVTTLIHSTVFI